MPTRPYAQYVALGDSMTIDKYAGPGLGAASLLYRNVGHPEFQGCDLLSLSPSTRFVNLAEDGSTSYDVAQSLERLPPDAGPTLVTLTVGGNDLLALLLGGSPEAGDLAAFQGRLEDILRRVRARYGQLVLLMGNVYDPSDGTGQVQSGHRRFAAGLPWLPPFNRLLADTAAAHGALMLDVHGHFRGHGMRHHDPAYEYYHPQDPSGWICFDIEPNPRGSSEIRRLFWEALP